MRKEIIKKIKIMRVYIENTSWIMLEKVVTVGLGFVMTIIMARYLGPAQFGILAYATSMVSILAVAGHAGLSGLVINELVRDGKNTNEILGTSLILKGVGYLFGLMLAAIIAFLTEEIVSVEFWVLLIVASSLVFKPTDIIEYWFQSELKAKYNAISRIGAAFIGSATKLILVLSGAKLIYFAFVHLLQTITGSAFLVLFFVVKLKQRLTDWRFSKKRGGDLFNQGWIILLGSVFAMIYLKIDQIMLKWLIGDEEVAIYAVAATLSEAWYFVPLSIVASAFPKLIQLKKSDPNKYHARFQQLFDGLFVISIVVATIVTLSASSLVPMLFGDAYFGSAPILVVHIWAALFIFMRAAFSKWIIIEKALIFSVISQGLGALANIALNYMLIPHYAGLGAAYATLASYAVASYLALAVHSRTRPIFKMMTKSMFFGIRVLLTGIKR